MAVEVFADQAVTAVTSGGTDAPVSGTVENWTVASSSAFPSASTGLTQFHVCDTATGKTSEIILVTNVSGTTWTVTRGAESTTPIVHSAGFTIQQAVTAGFLASAQVVIQPSGDTSGVKDAANINAAVAAVPAQGGTIVLAPSAQWYIECGQVVINRSGLYINAPGTYINAVGTGDVIRMYDNSGTFWPVYGGGITGFPVIDGTSAGAGSCAIHMGDLFRAVCDAGVQNFTGAGSIGVHFDNANYWTEQLYGRIYAANCTQHVVFDVTGATTSTSSFARASLGIYVNQTTASYDGLVLQNGAQVYNGDIALRGNFVGSASALTSAVLRVTGTVPAGHPFAGGFSQVNNCRLEVGCEVNSGFAHVPSTMLFGANGNVISNCYGILDYGGGSGTFTAAVRIGNIFPFNGAIRGDSTLQFGAQGFQSGATWNAAGGLALGDFSTATTIGTGGTISSTKALERVTTSGAVTGVILAAGSFDGQQLYIVNESGNSITFAASGTSHVADGTSDVIAAHAGATFIFEGNDTNLWYRC